MFQCHISSNYRRNNRPCNFIIVWTFTQPICIVLANAFIWKLQLSNMSSGHSSPPPYLRVNAFLVFTSWVLSDEADNSNLQKEAKNKKCILCPFADWAGPCTMLFFGMKHLCKRMFNLFYCRMTTLHSGLISWHERGTLQTQYTAIPVILHFMLQPAAMIEWIRCGTMRSRVLS